MFEPTLNRNRAGVERDEVITMSYQVQYTGQDTVMPIWLKDGLPFRIPPRSRPEKRPIETSINFAFTDSDAGVYQCVFIAIGLQTAQVYVTEPIRLDTGKFRLSLILRYH